MPTYEHLMLRTGQVIVEEWYDKLVKALNALANEASVTYDGVIKRSLTPESDLLMNLGEAGKRLLSGFFGYGYFTYEVRVGSTVRVLPDRIVFNDGTEQFRAAENLVAEHEAKNTGIHGVGDKYIAKTSRTDQFPSWDDIPDKPSTFAPSAHADTHKDGGTDEVVGIAKMGTTLPTAGIAGRFFIKTDTKELYYDDGTSWIKIGKLAGLDLDAHASRHNYGGDDPITDLDASQLTSGVLSLDRIPAIPPGKLDAIDTPTDGEVPSYNAAQGKFEWITPAAGVAGLDPELEGIIWYHTLFESSDIIGKGTVDGTVLVTENGLYLDTGDIPGNITECYLTRGSEYEFLTTASWEKERIWKCVSTINIAETTIYRLIFGDYVGPNQYVGFIFNETSGVCEGISYNGVDSTRVNLFNFPTDIDISLPHVYKIVFTPATKVEFYVDGVLKGTITTNLPSGTGGAHYLVFAGLYSGPTDTGLPYSAWLTELLVYQKA